MMIMMTIMNNEPIHHNTLIKPKSRGRGFQRQTTDEDYFYYYYYYY